MLNELLKNVLMISVSGSIIAIFLLILRPLIQDRFSKSWHYYIWLIVIARLIIPFGLPVNPIVDSMSNIISNAAAIESLPDAGPVTPVNTAENIEYMLNSESYLPPDESGSQIDSIMTADTYSKAKAAIDYKTLLPFIGLLWLLVGISLFTKKLISYYRFSRFIKTDSRQVDDDTVLDICYGACQALKLKKEIPIYSNKATASPMLIGLFRPVIVLPDAHMDDLPHLKYIFMHELTHYKRLDICYKWLVQIVICVHWFNPIAHLIGKEINKACELSCDEAVIKTLTTKEQRAYGDMLLNSFEMTGRYRRTVVSLSLLENSKFIKRRLGAIMKFRKKSKLNVFVSVLLTLLLSTGAMFTGAYAETPERKIDTGLWNIITVSESSTGIVKGIQKIEGIIAPSENLTIPVHIPDLKKDDTKQASNSDKLTIDIPSVSGDTFVDSYGRYSLTRDEQINAGIDWDGNGAVMFLYTQEKLSKTDIISLVSKGILPLDADNKASNGFSNVPSLSSNFTYVHNGKEAKFNFTTTPNKPIQWSNQVPEAGEYNVYIIATGNTGISNIKAEISFNAQTNKTADDTSANVSSTVWMPSRLTKEQLQNELKSWLDECDKKKDLYITSKGDMWYVYCNLIAESKGYALDMDNVSEAGVIIKISDIDEKGEGYALLSVPRHYGNIQASYNNKKVQFTEDDGNIADLDKDSTVLEYYSKNSWSANNCTMDINGYEASMEFMNFSGSKVIYELNYSQAVTADFRITADVTGEYKIAFITETNDVVFKASSYSGISASKPVHIPSGKTKVVLVGEQATGNCKIEIQA